MRYETTMMINNPHIDPFVVFSNFPTNTATNEIHIVSSNISIVTQRGCFARFILEKGGERGK